MDKGIIYKYINKEGETVRAVALYDEQKSCYSDCGKVFLRVLNNDYDFKKTEEGKNIVTVKNHSDLIRIGHWD